MAKSAPKARREFSTFTLLTSIWAVCALLWSIFTPPHRTFAARVLLFQPAWLLRAFVGDLTWAQDLALTVSWHAVYGFWTGAWKLAIFDRRWLDLDDGSLKVYFQVFAMLGGCGLFAGSIVHRGRQLDDAETVGPLSRQPIEDFVLPPLLIPSRTKHSRIFPQKHAFSYSYLFVGIPIGLRGSVGNVLSVDAPRPKWFHIDSADYLDRGKAHLGLGEKLMRYLHTQGVTDRDFAFAYLVTAPRFLGYSFNPVSFWYLYDSDTRLKYMILEVNNTFDERRMYLLRADNAERDEASGESGQSADQVYFTDSWTKDFHVSPFNSRKGSYSLKATDPLAAFQATGRVSIDNTIVLRSSHEHAKIVAKVWSEGAPKDPAHVTVFQLIRFVAAWWWVGLATFPRIVWEAQKLFFRKKLHVWFRPEVTQTSLGRAYTGDEDVLEEHFHAFLTHVVEHSSQPLRVAYEPAGNGGEEIVLYSPDFTYEQDGQRTLTLKVLSPAFYSRFVHYAHVKEAFDRECLTTHEKNRTILIEPPNLLPVLLAAIGAENQDARRGGTDQTFLERARWSWLRRTRCPPAAASYPSDSSRLDHEYNVSDIRAFHFSELDWYVQRHRPDADSYRRIATKLFLAERLALGLPPLIVLGDILLRSTLILAAMVYSDNSGMFDILRPRDFTRADAITCAWGVVLANSVHLWSFAKG